MFIGWQENLNGMTYSWSNALSSVWFVIDWLCLSKSSREAFAFHVTSMKRLIARLKIVAPWFHNSLNDNNDKKLNWFFLLKRHSRNKRTVFKRTASEISVPKQNIPSFCKHHGYWVTENFPLVGNVLHDVTGPSHQVPDFVARRRSINIPLEVFLDLFS